MHTDEAVQAYKTASLVETGCYRYDAQEYHGPILHYAALPSFWLSGTRSFADSTEYTYRVVPALVGAATVLLHGCLGPVIGPVPAVWAAAMAACSPAMVFYSRYYIHETLLVFLSFALLLCVCWYCRTQRGTFLLLAGLVVGLLHATKGTWVLVGAAMAGALVLTRVWPWRAHADSGARPRPSLRLALASTGIAIATAALLYSSFLTNAAGPLDSLRAFAAYAGRGTSGQVHNHPWYYYVQLLAYSRQGRGPIWTEGAILGLALVGLLVTVTGRGLCVPEQRQLARLLGAYSVLLAVLYAAIPYKTPWCLTGFLHGFMLLAGIGVGALIARCQCTPGRVVLMAVVALAVAHLAWEARRANGRFCADRRNPYVYAHTAPDLLNLAERVLGLARVHPDRDNMLVRVITPDQWPLPWYLRALARVGYWQRPEPGAVDAPVIISSVELQPRLEGLLHGSYHQEYYGLRPEVLVLLYVDEDLWQAYLQRRASPRGSGPVGTQPLSCPKTSQIRHAAGRRVYSGRDVPVASLFPHGSEQPNGSGRD